MKKMTRAKIARAVPKCYKFCGSQPEKQHPWLSQEHKGTKKTFWLKRDIIGLGIKSLGRS